MVFDVCLSCNIVPQDLLVREVECISEDNYAGGGYADVYCGTWRGEKVALKRLRTFQMTDGPTYKKMRKVRMTYVLQSEELTLAPGVLSGGADLATSTPSQYLALFRDN